MRVSVLIPTFRRPESFRRAALSVFAQSDLNDVELIAVDNSLEGSAIAAFRALESNAPIPFRWAHEPRPGVANARNEALRFARGELVAWLDDDEEAPPHWLAALVHRHEATDAWSVFGPVHAKAEGAHAAFFERLYSRCESGAANASYGIGNSLQSRALFGATPFDPAANQTGGEDDALFAAWRKDGANFAWAADAHVTEHVGAQRSRLAHGLKRAFAYGQGPCETAWAMRDYKALARHMSIGAAQTLVFGAASLACAPLAQQHALALLGQAASGAGKMFWMFEQRFYGEAAPQLA